MARDTFENKDEMDAPAQKDGLGNALVVITAVVLLIAFILTQQALKEQYSAGMFADSGAAK